MIQLQYSDTGSSTIAIWSDLQPPFTGSDMSFTLTSSFEGNYSSQNVVVSSNKSNAYNGGWILFNISNSLIPTASGQYIANIFEGVDGEPKVWNTTTEAWNTITDTWLGYGTTAYTWIGAPDNWNEVVQTWLEYGAESTAGRKITTERTFVSGSDYDEQFNYETQQELSYYSVYNG